MYYLCTVQFWNKPVGISPYDKTTPDGADLYIVNITVGGTHRNYVGVFRNATWEDDEEDCLYVGNAQAGPDGQGYSFNDAVITGNYKNYSINEGFSKLITYLACSEKTYATLILVLKIDINFFFLHILMCVFTILLILL